MGDTRKIICVDKKRNHLKYLHIYSSVWQSCVYSRQSGSQPASQSVWAPRISCLHRKSCQDISRELMYVNIQRYINVWTINVFACVPNKSYPGISSHMFPIYSFYLPPRSLEDLRTVFKTKISCEWDLLPLTDLNPPRPLDRRAPFVLGNAK